MNYCHYGCGKEGLVPFTSFYKKGLFRCSKSHTQCPARENDLKVSSQKAMTKINADKRSVAAAKRKERMGEIGEDGLSGFERAALKGAAGRRDANGNYKGSEKTRQTKRANFDSNGLDVYERAAIKTAITRFGCFGGLEDDEKFIAYRRQVLRYTLKQPLQLLENFEKRGAIGLAPDPYHIDHQVSVAFGFRNNIAPNIIGHICNLRMLPALENNSKGANCSLALETLYDLIRSQQ